jgi:hypothetical protein
VSEDTHATVYTREGRQELTLGEWINFDEFTLHREGDLPAVEYSTKLKEWYRNGIRHRETGPAIVWSNGGNMYLLAGVHYIKKEFYKKLQEIDELPLSLALTHEEEWIRERAKRRLE